MASILAQAFGSKIVDLYKDVLKVEKDSTLAQLRKAYYQQALQYHPDKNPSDDAKIKFQAISWTYQLLKDPNKRADYDDNGILPHDDEGNDSDDENDNGQDADWKDYFDTIFGKISTSDIDEFSTKYKMSPDEEQDVLKEYERWKGNLVKMLEYVILSEERDVPRWVEDYIRPAIDEKIVSNSFTATMERTLKQVQKKIEKERLAEKEAKKQQQQQNDDDETETEESDTGCAKKPTSTQKVKAAANNNNNNKNKTSSKANKKAPPPKKAKATKAKKAAEKSSPQDLIAAIRNKNRAGGNPFAALGARYGVSMDDDDPLDDAAFAKIQSKLKKKKK